jgi:hypothetical protein
MAAQVFFPMFGNCGMCRLQESHETWNLPGSPDGQMTVVRDCNILTAASSNYITASASNVDQIMPIAFDKGPTARTINWLPEKEKQSQAGANICAQIACRRSQACCVQKHTACQQGSCIPKAPELRHKLEFLINHAMLEKINMQEIQIPPQFSIVT